MRRAGMFTLATLAAALVVAVAANATPTARQASPTAWAHSVCSSVTQWNAAIQKRAAALKRVNGHNVAAVKTKLVAFLSGVTTDTQTLIAAVSHAGTPSIPHGAAAAHALQTVLTQTKTFFAQDVAKAKTLPVTRAAKFATAAAALGQSIGVQAAKIGAIFDSLDKRFPSKALDKAMKTDPACKTLK